MTQGQDRAPFFFRSLSPTDELDSGGSKEELRGKVTPWRWPEKRHLPGRISDSAPGPNVH